jgi:hypothetical protein
VAEKEGLSVCCASPAAWAPVEPSPNEIKKQASLELHGMFRLWLVLWQLARLLRFCMVTNMVVTQVNSKGPLALRIAARQNMKLKSIINKML